MSGPICGFCKQQFPNSTWEQLQEHIRTCEKHPMHDLLVEAKAVIEALDEGWWASGEPGGHPGVYRLREAVRRAECR